VFGGTKHGTAFGPLGGSPGRSRADKHRPRWGRGRDRPGDGHVQHR